MGYYTKYSLTIQDKFGTDLEDTDLYDEIVSDLTHRQVEYFSTYAKDGQPIKWYDHKEDLLKASIRYPDVRFVLKGIGEEYPDIWINYFVNGHSQFSDAKIIFDDYDETRLR